MRRTLLALAVFASLGAAGQDVLSIGSGSTQVPVTLAKNTANPVQAIAFKVLFDEDLIASVSFARAGMAAVETPLYETQLQGSGFFSYAVLFEAPANISGHIGTLTVTPQPSAVPGTVVPLTFDAPGALLSNQSASTVETVANGLLSLMNGSITVTGTIAAPSGVMATATSTSTVNVTWNAVAGANHYQVWRSNNAGGFVLIGTTGSTSFPNASLSANTTYLYRIRTVDGAAAVSPFSNIDAATTVVFTDDPVVAFSTLIKAVHFTQLRTAVNAMRAAGGLAPLAADGTIAAGMSVRAQHLTALRTGLNEARSASGMATLAFTDAVPTRVKAVHVNELRSGVK